MKYKNTTNLRRKEDKNIKALVLLSGGLDSRLACMIMQEQAGKKNVEALLFLLPFGEGCCADKYCVFNFCQKQEIKLRVVDCTEGKLLQEYMRLLKHPRYGRGTSLNPCIDCRIFMFKKAREIMEKNSFNIVVTGEVLGERPMSQRKKAMDIIESESGLKGKLLRPLSARLLPETELEKKRLLDREKFLDIRGRSRKKQIELAKRYGIDYPSPAGGCILCEKEFAKKLEPLLKKNKKLNESDVRLLKTGRHFENSKIILGRNESENKKIEIIFNEAKKYKSKTKGILLVPQQPGPTAFIKDKKFINMAKELIQRYSKHEIKDIKIKFTK